ncbi:MAG TPA: type II 3-dehydroquinate dehydratase [Gemmatimonadales bacterium]|nr:type II 3-dehydroquinate dehydratase [Gemmatimonadales bacterium]
MTSRILVLNGPNLNLLGSREPSLYGHATLADLERRLSERSRVLGIELSMAQSNHEGELVELVQGARARADGMIVNLGAYTHTSLAIRDAFLAAPLPFIEVHLSNLFRREPARHQSLVADLAIGLITGLGVRGYELALEGLVATLTDV